ncbi:MAG: hypothetical protein CVT94_09345 [Bacteroidetes bacterium HGW-Bacteroidetes-11]|nr:MAG: hypothetical protein CVT94_09345 [Bacteroidetes bacterium HGW-Bacteroidetes-11]
MTNQTLIGQYFRKTITILWAIAIFWFYLGNLINFHENRIWGKVLIPACFTHSSINKKDGGLLDKGGEDSQSFNFQNSFNAVQQFSDNLFSSIPSWVTVIKSTSNEVIIPAALADDHRLRGPPAA